MMIPTDHEIEAAWTEIDDTESEAHDLMMLALRALHNQRLRGAIKRLTAECALQTQAPKSPALEALVSSIMMTGLNCGLRIGQSRVQRVVREAGMAEEAGQEMAYAMRATKQ
jgi:hypothetical protein